MKILRIVVLFPVCVFLLYFTVVWCIMTVRYGRRWMWKNRAWEDVFVNQENIIALGKQVLSGRRLLKRRTMKTVTIYTDGACSGNPGPGGWGAILMYGPHKRELSGGGAHTTHHRMEHTPGIGAPSLLKEPCIVDLWSDSKYVIDGLEKGWAKGWKARGWKKADKKPALNPDLWDRLLALTEVHSLRYHWVKGHAENAYNNRCDELAVAESQKYK